MKYSGGPTILYGLEVPHNVSEALELDRRNGNHRWAKAIHKQMQGLQDHQSFSFLNPGEAAPAGNQFAPLKMIFTVKQDLRCKARLVIGGHIIDSSKHLGYSSVVKMTSMRLLNVIAKAQGLECLAGDVGNAYLNAKTNEKIFTMCGLEFGPEMVNHIAIVQKGLYGLKSSGNQWHSHFVKTISQMGFSSS